MKHAGREIKFRAWDKERKLMDIVTTISFASGLVQGKQHHNREYPQEIELMQYTGLKDKNGKEIYESDIVKEVLVGVVEYDAPSFYAITPKGSHFHANEDCEVIGNIYENPELLAPH